MFALREIFKDKLYALAGAGDTDVFTECFNKWTDTLYLHNFLITNSEALEFYNLSRVDAIHKIISEAENFEDDLLEIVADENVSLDSLIFTPLHKNDNFETPFLQSKAYGAVETPAFLRLYAIRLTDGCYIVVGGLIKTTLSLQECEEGKLILATLRQLANFLDENNFEDSYNISELIL